MTEKYTKPKIKAIELDTKQTILQACKVGGIWFTYYQTTPSGAAHGCGGYTSPGGNACDYTPKGGGGTTLMDTFDFENQAVPS